MTSPSNDEFLRAVFHTVPDGARLWVAGFGGAPAGAPNSAWTGRALEPGQPCGLNREHNTYFNISSVKPVGSKLGRKAENFAGLHVVVLDDVGTKAALPADVEPSYMVETSRGNHQAGFILAQPLADLARASAVVKALVDKGMTDPGANGPTSRYMRLPVGRNWKAEHNGWNHRCSLWAPERRFDVDDLVSLLGLDLASPKAKTKASPATATPTATKTRPAPGTVPDSEVMARLLKSPKARRLWEGDDTGHSSGSDADEWLLIMLAYQGIEADQIERVYSQAPRAGRKSSDGVCKWTARADYRQRSIQAALSYVEAHPNGNVEDAEATIEAALAIAHASNDARGLVAPEVIEALKTLKVGNPGSFDHYRGLAKKAGAKLATLDGEIQRLDGAGNLLHGDAAALALERLGGAESVKYTQAAWWVWKASVWKRVDSDEIIKKVILEVLPPRQLTAATVGSVLSLLRTMVSTEQPMGGNHSGGEVCVPCANGELVWAGEAWELRPHCREHLRVSVLPTPWEPDAKCPTFHRFLWDLVANDEAAEQVAKVRAIVEAIGYSLTTSTGLDRFVILHGPSASNGKSTLLNLIAAIAGPENTTALSVSQLSERFALSRLQGSLVNLCPEIARGEVLPEKVVKSLVSGDCITVERKGRDLYEIKPSTTLWFATNTLPNTRDLSPALIEKRCLLLELTRSFEGDQAKDTGLGAKLAAEAPGIMSFCLQAFGRALAASRTAVEETTDASGGMTTKAFADVKPMEDPPSSLKAKAAWKEDADPVRQFLEDRAVVAPGLFTSSADLFAAWQEWAEANGIKLELTARGLPKRVKVIAPEVETGDTVRLGQKRGIRGLALRDE
jgi:putative DNA primase/helicase